MKHNILLVILLSVSCLGYTQCGYIGFISDDNLSEHLCKFTEDMDSLYVTDLITCETRTLKISLSDIVIRRKLTRFTVSISDEQFNVHVYRIKYPTDAFLRERNAPGSW